MKGAVRRIRLIWNSIALLRVAKELAEMVGGMSALAKLSQLEDYYLVQIAKAVKECGLCNSKDEFVWILKYMLSERGWSCDRLPNIKRPSNLSEAIADYESLLEWVLDHTCELANGWRPEPEEAKALYAALITLPWYSAYRVALYTALKIPKEDRVLLAGAGLQEPLDYLTACKRAETEGWGRCNFAAMEVDPDVYQKLQELGVKHGFQTYFGWDSIKERFDAVVMQNILHWASNPADVFQQAKRIARKLYLIQGVLEGTSAGFFYTYAAGASRPVSYKTLLGLIKAAGWRPAKIYSKMPLFVGVFTD